MEYIKNLSFKVIIRYMFELLRFNAAFGIFKLLKGIDYYRVFEYPIVFSILDAYKKQNKTKSISLLDVGSSDTPFSLCLAKRNINVTAIDIDKKVTQLEKIAHKFDISNLKSIIADATKLPFLDNSFDRITAISSIEHVLPISDGDFKALKEIGRVLKPSGIAIITVPFNDIFSQEWIFQSNQEKYLLRRYNEKDIYVRLITPSNLQLIHMLFFCDDKKFYRLWYKLLVFFMAPISFIFAMIFLKIKEKPVNANGSVIILKKINNLVKENV